LVELLVSRGADLTITDYADRTPLIIAVDCCHTEVMRYLLGNRSLRPSGSSTIIDAQNYNGETALWLAACVSHVDMVKMLVEEGANPMIVDINGDTAMDIAKTRGHQDCIELLQVW